MHGHLNVKLINVYFFAKYQIGFGVVGDLPASGSLKSGPRTGTDLLAY